MRKNNTQNIKYDISAIANVRMAQMGKIKKNEKNIHSAIKMKLQWCKIVKTPEKAASKKTCEFIYHGYKDDIFYKNKYTVYYTYKVSKHRSK